MKNQFFNQWEINKIIEAVNHNPWYTKEKFEEYLKKYPFDYSTYTYYASNLIILGLYNEAEKILNDVENNYIHDELYCHNKNKIRLLKYLITINRLKLYSYREEYDKVLEIYHQNTQALDHTDIGIFMFYCQYKQGLIKDIDIDKVPYIFKQIAQI